MDQKKGQGIWYFTSGEKYAGGFEDNMVHGFGTFYQNGGSIVTGQW